MGAPIAADTRPSPPTSSPITYRRIRITWISEFTWGGYWNWRLGDRWQVPDGRPHAVVYGRFLEDGSISARRKPRRDYLAVLTRPTRQLCRSREARSGRICSI